MEVKRKIKNIIRNIIFSTGIKEVKIIKILMNKRHKRIEARRAELFKMYAKEALETIKDLLDEDNIEFWLDYGTLLGAMREKDFIEHDIDIDFGMRYDEQEILKLEEIFEKNNIQKYREFEVDGKIVEQTYSYKGLCFDMFYYFTDLEKMWCYGFTYKNSALKKESIGNKEFSTGLEGMRYVTTKRGVEKYIFKGKEYFVPENPHAYLIENYGVNYMIPIKEWDYVCDTNNQEKLDEKINIVMIEYF